MTIDAGFLARMKAMQVDRPAAPWRLPDLPPGVVPEKARLAMDATAEPMFAYLNRAFAGLGFLGYPFLGELMQRAEYRNVFQRVSFEMTRKWIQLKSASSQSKTEEMKIIEQRLKEFKVRSWFRLAANHDGAFGRGQLYIKMKGARATKRELASPLLESRYKIPLHSFQGLKIVEPIVTFPFEYNSSDPLADSYYAPRSWYVMGQQVHDSRMLTFISQPLPDLLKPAYNFGGMSMSQLCMETIENWLSTRQNVNRMIQGYSTSGIRTKMGDALTGGDGEDLMNRADLFVAGRDNLGCLILDKDTEEFFQYNAPISGLDKLQAQSLEHISAVSQLPLIILTGISPSGLNASSEGEIRVFYDLIHDRQESIFREPLEKIIRIIQLSEFGCIDPDVTFDFEPLWQADVEKLARMRKSDADAGVELIAAGVISAKEHREKMAKDPDSGYEGLDVDAELPEPDPNLVMGKDPLLAKTEGLEKPMGAV